MTTPTYQGIQYPRFRWPVVGTWLTSIGTLLAAVLVVVPTIVNWSVRIRIVLLLALTLAPAIVIAILHLFRRCRVVLSRARAYPKLTTELAALRTEFDQATSAISALIRDRQERNGFRIAYCYLYQDKPVIALHKKRGPRLETGVTLTVFDQDSGGVLGTFRVTDERGDHCLAIGSGPIDAVWLGYMKKEGTTQSQAPPGALAVYFPNDGDSDGSGEGNAETTT
ncbi:MAG: hypothetical protein V2A79_16315 [Planctomycetota bacterium]